MNKKLLLATTNRGKAKEIQAYLSDLHFEIFTLDDIHLKAIFTEKKKTFAENARDKSLFYSQFWPGLTLAEDSGLEINHLKGAPGFLSARFSSPQSTDEKNIQKVLGLMKGVPWEERKARFVCCIVLSQQGKAIKEIMEHADGLIALNKKGQHGFGYDPIFFYPPLEKTFAELSPEEKNKVSHRGRSLKKLKTFLSDYLKKGDGSIF